MYSKTQKRSLLLAEGLDAVHALVVDDDDLAGLDVADEVGADDVQRAGLGGQHPAAGALGPMRPRTSGRTPSGSRTPISASLDSATSE